MKAVAERAGLALGVSVLAIVLIVHARLTFWSVVDDAYISARYAAQLNAGHGLVYNVGERIEGYTDLAWVLCLAAAIRAGIAIQFALPGLGLLFAVIALPLSAWLARILGAKTTAGVLVAPLVLALDPHFAVGATIGLEASQFTAGVLLAACLVLSGETRRVRALAGVSCGLLGAIRPEGYFVGFALVVFDLWKRRARLRDVEVLVLPAVAALIVALLLGWRYATYGSVVANTFVAKAGHDIGRQAARNFAFYGRESGYWFALATMFAFSAYRLRRRPEARIVGVLALGLVGIAFRVHEWMPGARLLLPAIALFSATIAAAIAELTALERKWMVVPGTFALGFLAFGPLGTFVRHGDAINTVLPGNGAERAATHLARFAPNGAVIATRDAGVIAYFAGPQLRLAELHERALTQPHVGGANARIWDYTPHAPEFVILTTSAQQPTLLGFAPERELWGQLTRRYVHYGRVSPYPTRYYEIYVREDLDIPPIDPSILAGPPTNHTNTPIAPR